MNQVKFCSAYIYIYIFPGYVNAEGELPLWPTRTGFGRKTRYLLKNDMMELNFVKTRCY